MYVVLIKFHIYIKYNVDMYGCYINTNYRIKTNYIDIINVYLYKYHYGNVIYVINVS